jgi:hypothetical protein
MWQLLAVPAAIGAYYFLSRPDAKAKVPPHPQGLPRPIDLGQPKPVVVNVPVQHVDIPVTPHTATIPVPPATVPATVDPVTKVVAILETVITGVSTILNPGPVPVFSATPAAGLNVTETHKVGQRNLVTWAQTKGFQVPGDSAQYLPVLGGVAYGPNDVTGKIDPRTRATTWLFQRWVNFVLQPGDFQGSGANLVFVPKPITEDGLFGPQTYAALASSVQ